MSDISDDGAEMKDSTEIMHPEQVVPEDPADGEPDEEEAADGAAEESQPKKKKKKKKKKGKGNRSALKAGADQPSGFEEYFVDPPVTPAEYEEEKELYDIDKDFQERIELAVQRFTARRKFGTWQRELFDKYLAFGGFDTGPKQFGGVDMKEDGLTAAEIARLKVSVFVSKWVLENEGEVDFDGTLKAFFSTQLTKIFYLSTHDEIKARVNIIRNFFNYLLHHNVCPEYKEQIMQARKTCDQAEEEIWLTYQAARSLPGDFNKACSVLFGGHYQLTGGGSGWQADDPSMRFGFSHQEAENIFMAGMSALSSQEVFDKYQQLNGANKVSRKNTYTVNVRVTEIQFADENVQDFYNHNVVHGLSTLGYLSCETYIRSDNFQELEDLTDKEQEILADVGPNIRKYMFFVEDKVLKNMFVGMVICMGIHETNFGLRYFDIVTGTMVSFLSYIPNAEMEGWREHVLLEQREKYDPPQLHAYVPEQGEKSSDATEVKS